MAEDLPGINIPITGDYSNLQDALTAAESLAASKGKSIADAIGEAYQAGATNITEALRQILTATQGMESGIETTFSGTKGVIAGWVEEVDKAVPSVEKLGTSAENASGSIEQLGNDSGSTAPKVENLGNEVKNVGTSAEASVVGVGNLLKSLLAFSGIQVSVQAIRDFVEASSSIAAENERTTEALGLMTGSAEQAADMMSRLKDVAQQLAVPVDSLEEITRKLTAYGLDFDTIQAAIRGAADAAAYTGTPFETMASKLERIAESGMISSRTLKDTGITMQDLATTMGTSVDQVKKVFQKLSQDPDGPQKIMEILAETIQTKMGGAAEKMANDTTGQLQKAANAWHDFKEAVGNAINPILVEILPSLTAAIGKLSALGALVVSGLKEIIDSVIGLANVGGAAIDTFLTVLGHVTEGDFKAAITDVQNGYTVIQAASQTAWDKLTKDAEQGANAIIALNEKQKTSHSDLADKVEKGTARQIAAAAQAKLAYEEQEKAVESFAKTAQADIDKLPDSYQAYVDKVQQGGETAQAAMGKLTSAIDKAVQLSQTMSGAPLRAMQDWIDKLEAARLKAQQFADSDAFRKLDDQFNLWQSKFPEVGQAVYDTFLKIVDELQQVPGALAKAEPELTKLENAVIEAQVKLEAQAAKTQAAFDKVWLKFIEDGQNSVQVIIPDIRTRLDEMGTDGSRAVLAVADAMHETGIKAGEAQVAVGTFIAALETISTKTNNIELADQEFHKVQNRIQDLTNADIPALIKATEDYKTEVQNSGLIIGDQLTREEAATRLQIAALEEAGLNATEYKIRLQELEREHENVRNSASVWDDIRVKLDATKTSVGQLKDTIATDFVKAYQDAFKGFSKGLADLIVDGGSFTETMGKIFKDWAKKTLEDVITILFKPLEDALAQILIKIGQTGKGPGGIPIPTPGGKTTASLGPTGTQIDPVYVIVENMPSLMSGGTGDNSGGSSTGAILAGLGGLAAGAQIGNLGQVAMAGFPGGAGAGGAGGLGAAGSTAMLTTLAAALPFAIPAYFALTDLFGDKGKWYNDPNAFAQDMFRMNPQFQMSNPQAQQATQGLFGLPTDKSYWDAATAAFTKLQDAALAAQGLPTSGQGTTSGITATPEEQSAAVKTLTDSINALKSDQSNLTQGLIKAIGDGNLQAAALINQQLTAVNQSISAEEGLLSRIQTNTGDAVNSLSGVVASSSEMADALKNSQATVDSLTAQEKDLQQQIIVALAKGDTATADRLATQLGVIDGQLQTANGYLDFIKAATQLTASQQALVVQATAKAFGPDALKPLIDTIDSLRGQQIDLQTQLAEAVKNGDTELANQLAQRLDTVNGQLETARGQFSELNTSVQAQAGNSAEVVAATQGMEEALKTGDIKAISDAATHLQDTLNQQPDKIAKAQADLMSAIMSGNTADILSALGELQSAMADSAKEATAKLTSDKLDALKGIQASVDDQAAALQNAKASVDDLKGQQYQLFQDLIIATAQGDTDLVSAINAQLSTVNGALSTAQGSYDQLLALIPSQVDRIITSLGDISSNLARVATQEAGTLGLPGNFTTADLAKFSIPTDPAKIMDAINMVNGMIPHFQEMIDKFDPEAIQAAIDAGDKQKEAQARAQLAADQESLNNWRTLLGLLTIALAATGNLTPAQLNSAITTATQQITDLTGQQTQLNKMLVLATDPTQRAIIQGQLSKISTDLSNANSLLNTLNSTNLDGTKKVVDAVNTGTAATKDAAKTGTTTSGTIPATPGSPQATLDTINPQIKALQDAFVAARDSGNLDLAFAIGKQLEPLLQQQHTASEAINMAQIQADAFKSAYGTPATVADFDKIIAGIKPQLQYAIDNGNKPLIDQLNAQLSSLQSQRDALAATKTNTAGTATNTADTAKSSSDTANNTNPATATKPVTDQIKALDTVISSDNALILAAQVRGDTATAKALSDQVAVLTAQKQTLVDAATAASSTSQSSKDIASNTAKTNTAVAAVDTTIAVKNAELQAAIISGNGDLAAGLRDQIASLNAMKDALPAAVAAGQDAVVAGLLAIASAIAAIQPSITNNNYYNTSTYSSTISNYAGNPGTGIGAAGTETNPGSVGGGSGAAGGRRFAVGGYDPVGGMAYLEPGEYVLTPEELSSLTAHPLTRLHEKMTLPVPQMASGIARVPTVPMSQPLPNPSGAYLSSGGAGIQVDKVIIYEAKDPRNTVREMQRFFGRLSPKIAPYSA